MGVGGTGTRGWGTGTGRGYRDGGGDTGTRGVTGGVCVPQGAYAIVELREAAGRELALAAPRHELAGQRLRVRPRQHKGFTCRPPPGRGAHREPLEPGELEQELCRAADVSLGGGSRGSWRLFWGGWGGVSWSSPGSFEGFLDVPEEFGGFWGDFRGVGGGG